MVWYCVSLVADIDFLCRFLSVVFFLQRIVWRMFVFGGLCCFHLDGFVFF